MDPSSSPGPSAPIVTLEDVHKDYPRGSRVVHALRGVTLGFAPASFVVIEGTSGSGKTTLLNLIGCLDQPTRGRVLIKGRDTRTMDDDELSRFRADELGFVFQEFNLIPVLTARENVEFPLRLKGVPAGELRPRTEAALEAVGLQGDAWRRPGELSGGQCQRVAIARAIVTRPGIVVADEPTANLDSRTGAAVVELMRSMARQSGTAFVIATHDPAVACHATHRYRLHDGQVVAS